MTTNEELLIEALELLAEAENMGLTFDVGNAYISRAYVNHQRELRAKIKDFRSRV